MPARVENTGGRKNPEKVKAPKVVQTNVSKTQPFVADIQKEMESLLTQGKNMPEAQESRGFSNLERAQFYGGHDRSKLQGSSVQRVRDLQEENDHLQREINAKESEIAQGADPLAILADIEHRKVIIARNTGEILKIYLKNEERLKRIKELESQNGRIQNEMMEMQGQFISTKCLDEKTKFASDFFVLKSQIERNLIEISELNKV